MFKNKAFQIKMVDDKSGNPGPVTNVYNVDAEEISKIITESTVKIVGSIGAVIAGHKLLSTICEIAVVATKAKLK